MRLNLEVTFELGDWLVPLQGQAFDIIVDNLLEELAKGEDDAPEIL